MSASEAIASPILQGSKAKQATGGFVDVRGERFYRISDYDAMPPFFMSIVSHSDHYLFISSNGGLTAGRKDPDHTLFPYYNDDRIHDSSESTGSKTLIRVHREAGPVHPMWEPFSVRSQGCAIARNLYKSVYGNKIVFEEINHTLGLSFSYEWAVSELFGFVRTARLANLSSASQSIELVDGVQNVMPCGLTRRFQMEYSTLANGYKRTELDGDSGLAMFALTSLPVDRPEPSESLRANVAWAAELNDPLHLLSSAQLDRFRNGQELAQESDIPGQPGAYFVNFSLELAPHSERAWKIVSDVNKDSAGVRSLLHTIKHDSLLALKIDEDVAQGTAALVRLVGAADGLQKTRDEASTWHHFASTLFNIMRGGIPDDNYSISRDDFSTFVREINTAVACRHATLFKTLPQTLSHQQLLREASAQADPDLERIAHEYLPLTFSRRHGDPSRPWNIFDIRVKDEQGRKILNYQGNWRDIFQNWEALSHSYPGYALSMVFKFLDSSTADGYNPYRVTRDGYDWEVLDPHDPWSCIGYWGDHQAVYLLRLLEQVKHHEPDVLARLLTQQVFSFANVPYRIRPYAEIVKDPQRTIVFDFDAHRAIMERAAKIGADGKACTDAEGNVVRANLSAKLLVLLLAKLSNFVPEAGLWMNTQRPEWNDANNALVGAGTSMVTLYYLRRFIVFLRDLFVETGVDQVSVPSSLGAFFASTKRVLEQHVPSYGASISARERKIVLDALGEAGSQYREHLYREGLSNSEQGLSVSELVDFLDVSLQHVDHSIRANRRSDGLYHAYNLIERRGDELCVHNLPLMLEGQVAILNSGVLSEQDAVQLLDSLRGSSLYRKDQDSYMLYPYKELPSFLHKNNIAPESAMRFQLLRRMLELQDQRIVVRDRDGGVHFNAAFHNVSALRTALAGIKDSELAELAAQETDPICDLYEQVFQHRFFTGRSGAFYKYEGIGCIYWHMIAKLLLAVGEVLAEAARNGGDESVLSQLRAHYNAVRAGLGTHKAPTTYGAVPTDPYSHTPGFAGAQQPGMTGQVKEDFISRLGEMGVEVSSGKIHFVRERMTSDEYLNAPCDFEYWDVNGTLRRIPLVSDTLAFTLCQVPVTLHRSGAPGIVVTNVDGSSQSISGNILNSSISKSIFDRSATIERLDVFLGCDETQSAHTTHIGSN